MTVPVDSEKYDDMLRKYRDEEITEAEASEFFGENLEEATGTVVAMRHIDSADDALDELFEMDFDDDDDGEPLAQVLSIARSLRSNEENGYSPEELAEFLEQYDEMRLTSQQFAVAENISDANTAPNEVDATSTDDLSVPDDDLLD
ncbi:hypothetical protein [Natranaeroarchaeum aerophilus]|uniref:Uncharacterized protein n=1 Tax=Natranaeroarchaeum aerophilus TaxID=2917711 RepID=A0AAE3FUB5_9EURY|nr:hypothetical protein [Natranaeroarchaeum aerophilus]MCL9815088.1 hypothetical protein [Natranaeroarchaeum aerophilus]